MTVFESLLDFAMDVQYLRQQTNNAIPKTSLSELRKSFVMGAVSELPDQQAILQELIAKVRISLLSS